MPVFTARRPVPFVRTAGSQAWSVTSLSRCAIQRGHRNIAFIGNNTDETVKGTERRRGYLEGIHELGLGRGTVISLGTPPIRASQSCEALVRLVQQYPEVDAVVCVSDLIAFGAMMECQRRGWAVPGKISIAGFGNSEVSAVCNPGITTVAINVANMGLEIGRVLLDALSATKKGKTSVPTTHMVDYKIIERESTRPALLQQ
jgi:LacI family gluconate utilization system Gnt-I transcriptional repressor